MFKTLCLQKFLLGVFLNFYTIKKLIDELQSFLYRKNQQKINHKNKILRIILDIQLSRLLKYIVYKSSK